jgi:hypothetical protein
MPQSPPKIPNRVASWAALNDRQVNHRASKSDLKQKLSDKTLEEGSERHVKLRIDSIELDHEELKIENEGLRLEKIEQAMDSKKYQKMRSKDYKRIVSLGDDLWGVAFNARYRQRLCGGAPPTIQGSEDEPEEEVCNTERHARRVDQGVCGGSHAR